VVDLDGDHATGFCSLELRMVENGVWKFAHRKLVFYHRVPLSRGWA